MDANSKLSPEDKEASEKLFENNSKPKIEILTQDSQPQNNGDTMINIAEVSHAFVGMGKEELMKFANDPFWVKLRWFLFALFWLMWLGMLAGAVAIIFFAPKCTPPQKQILTDQTFYEVSLEAYTGEETETPIQAFSKRSDYIKDLGVTSVIFNPLMSSSKEGFDHVIDFKGVDPNLGTLDQLKDLLKNLKEKGIKTFLKVVPNFSSIHHEWFNKSSSRVEPYKDYYIWNGGKNSGGSKNAPNNWLSVSGGSAWTWDETRQEFYYHQFKSSQPDLNFRNENVSNYFSDVFKHWLTVGFNGIHVDKVEYLFEEESLSDEIIDHSVHGAIHDDYRFWTHFKTTNLAKSTECLKTWSQEIKNASGLVTASGVSLDYEKPVVDLTFLPFKEPTDKTQKRTHLHNYISHNLERKNVTWLLQFDNKTEAEDALAIEALMLLLPGSALIYSGDELGQPKFTPSPIKLEEPALNSTNKKVDFFQKYQKLIKIKTALAGSNKTVLSALDSQALIVTRPNVDDLPGYMFLYNPDNVEVNAVIPPLKEFRHVNKVIPVVLSDNFKEKNEEMFSSGKNETLKNIILPANSFAVLEILP